ncbi:MAG: potassium channel family protein, partial [Bacteroidales bacterium]|nr:potassium channel family protein [Bacteroidales bacterium]
MKNRKRNLFKNWLIWGLVISSFFLIFQFFVYTVEKQNTEATINSFADALWYGIVTLAAVGYGDMVPVTVAGKLLGGVLVLSSIALMGALISQFTNKIRQVMDNKKLGYMGTKMRNHCVIIGWDDFAMNVTNYILESGKKISIVTDNKDDIDLIYNKFGNKNVFVLFSSYSNTESYELLNIQQSSSVFINFNDDSETLVRLLNTKQIYPSLNYIVSLNNAELKDTFKAAGVTFAISNHEVASKLVASYNFEPDVAYFTENIMSSAKDDDDHDLVEFKINKQNKYINYKYIDTFVSLKKDYNAILMGLSRKEKENYTLYKNPKSDITIKENDYLIILVD